MRQVWPADAARPSRPVVGRHIPADGRRERDSGAGGLLRGLVRAVQADGTAVDAVAAANRGRALVGKLDTDRAPRTASEFQIRGIPTVIVFSGGREVARQSGAVPQPVLEALLRRATAGEDVCRRSVLAARCVVAAGVALPCSPFVLHSSYHSYCDAITRQRIARAPQNTARRRECEGGVSAPSSAALHESSYSVRPRNTPSSARSRNKQARIVNMAGDRVRAARPVRGTGETVDGGDRHRQPPSEGRGARL